MTLVEINIQDAAITINHIQLQQGIWALALRIWDDCNVKYAKGEIKEHRIVLKLNVFVAVLCFDFGK